MLVLRLPHHLPNPSSVSSLYLSHSEGWVDGDQPLHEEAWSSPSWSTLYATLGT